MWGKRAKRIEDVQTAQLAQLVELEKRLDVMEQAELARDDLYEKMRTLYARLNKRTQREEGVEPAAPAAPLNPAAIRLLNPYARSS